MGWSEFVSKGLDAIGELIPGIKVKLEAKLDVKLAGRDSNIKIQIGGKHYRLNFPEGMKAEDIIRAVSSPGFRKVADQNYMDYITPHKDRIPELSEPERDRLILDAVNSSMSSSLVSTGSVPPSKSPYRPEYGEGGCGNIIYMDSAGEQATLAVNIGPVPPKKYDFEDGEGM
ncbi:hypothetical protein LCGC14_1377070 [marine sediment metagenome]|uniref:Uncharacterized protein n=1 Tax=marine sediment metagenome TaxID=412755 RepID=A0A0F9KPN7_9ZZZZ|nr:hypothetical protein [Desulfobacterales bacterium]